MFDHIDKERELRCLRELLSESTAVAFHADADGFISAFLSTRLVDRSRAPMFQVFTEDLDLTPLSEWVTNQSVDNVITFDVNVFSSAGALARLAARLTGQVRVYDDHLGVIESHPANTTIVNLLPAEPDNLPSIRPASLFCYAILPARQQFHDFIAVAAAHGEGVVRHFRQFLPQLDNKLSELARKVGWGINAYYTDTSLSGDDSSLMDDLIDLAETYSPNQPLTRMLTESTFVRTVLDADVLVSRLVSDEAGRAARSTPWFEKGGVPVYLVDVRSPRRIVNLVASAARTRLDHGIVISRQDTPAGVAIELRRARSLNQPDLATALLGLDPTWFISRGGHPMAAGATLVRDHADLALRGLADQLTSMLA